MLIVLVDTTEVIHRTTRSYVPDRDFGREIEMSEICAMVFRAYRCHMLCSS